MSKAGGPASEGSAIASSDPNGKSRFPTTDAYTALRRIGQALSAGYDLEETLTSIAELAREITGAVYATILLPVDQNWLVTRAACGPARAMMGLRLPVDQSLAGRAFTSKTLIHTPNAQADPRIRGKAYLMEHRIGSLLAAPLIYGGDAIGVLTVGTRDRPDFTADEISLISAFADHAAVAVERARTRNWEREELDVVSTVLRAVNSIAAAPNVPAALESISKTARQILGTDRCVIWLADSSETILTPACPPGMADGMAAAMVRLGLRFEDVPILVQVVRERRTIVIENTRGNPLVPQELASLLDVASIMDVPILHGDRLLGMLGMSNAGPHHYTHRERGIAEGLASLAAGAIESARTVARLEETSLAEERGRLAREVHDTLGQELVAMASRVDLCHDFLDNGETQRCREELDTIREILSSQIQEVRRSIAGLRPLELEKYGFETALSRYLSNFANRTGITGSLTTSGSPDGLPGEIELVLYRVVQEALSNVRKHSRATAVTVELRVDRSDAVSLVVSDNGTGNEPGPDAGADGKHGVGLKLMRERIERAGGTLAVAFLRGSGTRVTVEIPRRPR